METVLEALLALQEQDVVIHGLEARLAALEPRVRELVTRQQRIVGGLERANAAIGIEEQKQAFLRDKLAEHKKLIEHNQATMDSVKTMKQATAAVAQMDQAKKIVAGEESDLLAINRRLEDLRAVRNGQQAELDSCVAEQEVARGEVAAERGAIETELVTVREARGRAAERVDAGLRAKYDRIRSRTRVEAVFKMRDMSCSNCDTAIPMQRRHVMSTTGAIDLCEACGVLMYFAG